MFDTAGNIGAESKNFLTDWMEHYVAWVKKYST
jgi:chromate reductase, NAD(P)H dehydrogenase (quinone)